MLPLSVFKFTEIGDIQLARRSEKVSKLVLRAAFILNVRYNGLYSILGNITCEHW